MKEGGYGSQKVGLAFVWNLDPLSVSCALGDVEGFGGRLGGGLLGILFSCLCFFVCFLNHHILRSENMVTSCPEILT